MNKLGELKKIQSGGGGACCCWGGGGGGGGVVAGATFMIGDSPQKDSKKSSKGKHNSFICQEISLSFLHYSELMIF